MKHHPLSHPSRKIRIAALSILSALTLTIGGAFVYAHCQVPCGIFTDELRFAALYEDIVTIEKSMKQIDELSSAAKPNHNQIVRWITTKEDHANKISEVITEYFLRQRVKTLTEGAGEAEQKAYIAKLVSCHEILVASMKAKQSTDTAHTAKLKTLVDQFKVQYFGKEALAHLSEHHQGAE